MRSQFTCRGALPPEARAAVTAALAEGEEQRARFLDENFRSICGASLDEVIAEIPEDGEEHAVACPKCGLSITVRRVPMPAPADAPGGV